MKFRTCLTICLLIVLLTAVGMVYLANGTSDFFSASPRPATAATKSKPHHLMRIAQFDSHQYVTQHEEQIWAASDCSAAALAEVMNYYSHTYRIHDVLTVEIALHEITPQLGLLEDAGIQRTAAHFGFTTTWGYRLTLDQVINLARHGTPIMISFPPAKSAPLYPGGHVLIVTGGTSTTVFVADSSRLDRTSFSRSQFLDLWGGFSAMITPMKGGQR
ncbi:MAG: cysteine peptidase family C39 domain-containing protein [Ktedonobacteraceae bacterium]